MTCLTMAARGRLCEKGPETAGFMGRMCTSPEDPFDNWFFLECYVMTLLFCALQAVVEWPY